MIAGYGHSGTAPKVVVLNGVTVWVQCDDELTTRILKIEGVAITDYMEAMDEFEGVMDEGVLILKRFGAAINRVWDQHYKRMVLRLAYWKPAFVDKFVSQTPHNLALDRFHSGAPPMNRGRHFNRKVHWKRR
ncbi:hypothetical protein KAR91_62555 [Candidatus Pacearchaeota archaeon]|nr:hypothetical protein [Candidatus Pacearchaeota archaeon]